MLVHAVLIGDFLVQSALCSSQGVTTECLSTIQLNLLT